MNSEDPGERTVAAVQDTLKSIKNRPHRQQVILGVGSGLVAGYIFAKIGRAAALLLGGTMIALQCAVQQDCIRINWRKVEQASGDLKLNSSLLSNRKSDFKSRIFKVIEENRVFFGSFGGGFLIAVSFA